MNETVEFNVRTGCAELVFPSVNNVGWFIDLYANGQAVEGNINFTPDGGFKYGRDSMLTWSADRYTTLRLDLPGANNTIETEIEHDEFLAMLRNGDVPCMKQYDQYKFVYHLPGAVQDNQHTAIYLTVK